MTVQNSPFAAELSAALQWWQMAGVDSDFADDATDWLADKGKIQPNQTPAAPQTRSQFQPADQKSAPQTPHEAPQKKLVARQDLLGETPPADLEEFHQWWMEAPGLDAIGPRGRVAPRGSAHPELMILVIDPEERDRDTLLNGPQGRLLKNMLSAMGVDEDAAYIASALPRHTPMADAGALAAGGMDRVTLHHIGLVSPQKLIAFGSGILPLIGQDVSRSDTYLREINQNARKTPVLMSEGLDSLLAMPRLKARFWRRWMEWSALE